MRLENNSDELSPGRLFIHGQLNDPMTGGPLYCRILSFDAAWVEYEPIYHREDGSERLGSPPRLPIGGFFEETFGGWYEGTWAPPATCERLARVCRYRWSLGRSVAGQPAPDTTRKAVKASSSWSSSGQLPADPSCSTLRRAGRRLAVTSIVRCPSAGVG